MNGEFNIAEEIAFDFAKQLSTELGYDLDDSRLKRIATRANFLITAGAPAPQSFAEAIDEELLLHGYGKPARGVSMVGRLMPRMKELSDEEIKARLQRCYAPLDASK